MASAQESRWSVEKANQWYQKQPWLVGSNFIPSNAINQLEMWQAETFDPQEIDRELGWAEAIGMNTMRVFLHDLLGSRTRRVHPAHRRFLAIAARHHIRPVFVLFDSCWDPYPGSVRSIRRFRVCITRDGCRAQARRACRIRRNIRGSKPMSRESSEHLPRTIACSRGTYGMSQTMATMARTAKGTRRTRRSWSCPAAPGFCLGARGASDSAAHQRHLAG